MNWVEGCEAPASRASRALGEVPVITPEPMDAEELRIERCALCQLV